MISSDESDNEHDVSDGGITEDVVRRAVQCNASPQQDDAVDKVSCIRT